MSPRSNNKGRARPESTPLTFSPVLISEQHGSFADTWHFLPPCPLHLETKGKDTEARWPHPCPVGPWVTRSIFRKAANCIPHVCFPLSIKWG